MQHNTAKNPLGRGNGWRRPLAPLAFAAAAVTALAGMPVVPAHADVTPNAGLDLSAALTSPTVGRDTSVRLGATTTLHGTVANVGTVDATSVVATLTLVSQLEATSATASNGGSCTIAVPKITCSYGSLAAGASATFDVAVDSPVQVGTFPAALAVTSAGSDTNTANNSASASVLVTAAPKQIAPVSWQADGKVDDIRYIDDVEYLVGEFNNVISPLGALTPRRGAAAIRVSTQELLPWAPDLGVGGEGHVVNGRPGMPWVYIGGLFSTVNGLTHNNLVAVEPALVGGVAKAGVARETNPNFNPLAMVNALEFNADGSKVYAGGLFHAVQSNVSRELIAAWSTATGALDPFAPIFKQQEPYGEFKQPNCPPRCFPSINVLQLAPDGQSLYVGGSFAWICLNVAAADCKPENPASGILRHSAARVSLTDGSVMAWDPNVYFSATTKGSQNVVYDLTQFNGNVYLCGDFWRVGGDDNAHVYTNFAGVDGVNGLHLPGFGASTDGAVNGCTATDTEIIIGGHFQNVSAVPQGAGDNYAHNHIAAIDATTGAVDPGWNPFINSSEGVYATRFAPGRLGVGGEFTQVNVRNNQGATEFLYDTPSTPAPTKLTVAGIASPTVAGTAKSVTVTVKDQFGTVFPGYLGTVHFTSSDVAAGLPADYTFTAADAGSKTFPITFTTAGTQSVTAADTASPGINGKQTGISVTPAPAASFTVSGLASPRTAGAGGSVTVKAFDAFGNAATTYAGTVAITSSDPIATLPANYTFTAGDAGTHAFPVTLKRAGAQSVTATDTAAASVTGTLGGIQVNPAAASLLFINGLAPNQLVGVAATGTVVASDAFFNVATAYTGTVHFTSSDPKAKLPADYKFTAGDQGAHVFTDGFTFGTTGNQTVTGADKATPAIKGVTPAIAVTAKVQGSGNPDKGYWLSTSDGGIFNFGTAPALGSLSHLNKPVVGMTPTPTGNGFWLVATDGGIFTFGDAGYFGSTGAVTLNKPIVGMAATPTGKGYWLVASDGGLFTFGDAGFFGSLGATPLNKPVVGMTVTPTGKGYVMVASDGGIFTFGDSQFFGSTGAITLNRPIVGMALNPTGTGYWLYASDGGIFTFGAVGFFGSGAEAGAHHLNSPAVGAVSTQDGLGYWIYDRTGEVRAFGSALFFGDASGSPLPFPIAAMASRP